MRHHRLAQLGTLIPAQHKVPAESLESLTTRLISQGAAESHLTRLAALRALCEHSPHCLGLALVGSFAQGVGDRISDLDLAASVADDRGAEFLSQADEILGRGEVLNAYGQVRPGKVAFRKYVYLDFASCEFHAFNQRDVQAAPAPPVRMEPAWAARDARSGWFHRDFKRSLEACGKPD